MKAPPIVERSFAGKTFKTVDPATFPYGNNTFDDPEPILIHHWPHLGPGDVVVDVGAAFGAYTLPALALGAKVIAFEPSDAGYPTLCRSIRANAWPQWRTIVVRSALFDGTPYPEALRAEVFTQHYRAGDFPFETMDDVVGRILRSGWCHRISHIKVDVEGAELGVLKGAAGILRAHHPVLYVEDHELSDGQNEVARYPASIHSGQQIETFLEELGYLVVREPWSCGRSYIVAHPR